MKIWTAIVLGLLVLTCCQQSGGDSMTTKEELSLKQQSRKLDNKEVPEKILTLNTTTGAKQEKIDENLFGKFFCDRAEFYIIKNPQNKIYSSSAESITLYYLDNQLRQTKYFLTNNILDNLLRELGSFKITGMDPKNRQVLKTEEIVIRTKSGITLNNKLDNFELRWIFGEKEIKYRVSSGSENKFIYAEKARDFEKEFKAIEKYCS